jgi:hypothetical protein
MSKKIEKFLENAEFLHESKTNFEKHNRLADRSTFHRFYCLNETKLVQRFEHFASFVERDENNEFEFVSDDEVCVDKKHAVYVASYYVKIRFYKFSREKFENCASEREIVELAEQLASHEFSRLLEAFARFLKEEAELAKLRRAAFLAMLHMKSDKKKKKSEEL